MTERESLCADRFQKWLWRAARRFKAGSWANRTLYRTADYVWFWFIFKRVWR